MDTSQLCLLSSDTLCLKAIRLCDSQWTISKWSTLKAHFRTSACTTLNVGELQTCGLYILVTPRRLKCWICCWAKSSPRRASLQLPDKTSTQPKETIQTCLMLLCLDLLLIYLFEGSCSCSSAFMTFPLLRNKCTNNFLKCFFLFCSVLFGGGRSGGSTGIIWVFFFFLFHVFQSEFFWHIQNINMLRLRCLFKNHLITCGLHFDVAKKTNNCAIIQLLFLSWLGSLTCT